MPPLSPADLDDEESTLATEALGERAEPFTVGLLVPIAGERSALGVEIVRAVQLALTGQVEVGLIVVDEGGNEEDLHRAFDVLRQRGARWVIGPTREEYGFELSRWAQQGGVDVYLLAPWLAALHYGNVHVAAPGLRDRLAAVRGDARQRRRGVTARHARRRRSA